jgi:macrodomain Ter protein organizer (MatP/YcbG family)
MARQRYKLIESDRWFAHRWIEKKLEDPTWLGEYRTYKATRAFELHNESRTQNPTESLNRWCETWLKSDEWTQLKNAIRASRRRANQPGTKTVTLSHNAWSLLDYVATKEACTLSETIERYLSRNGDQV